MTSTCPRGSCDLVRHDTCDPVEALTPRTASHGVCRAAAAFWTQDAHEDEEATGAVRGLTCSAENAASECEDGQGSTTGAPCKKYFVDVIVSENRTEADGLGQDIAGEEDVVETADVEVEVQEDEDEEAVGLDDFEGDDDETEVVCKVEAEGIMDSEEDDYEQNWTDCHGNDEMQDDAGACIPVPRTPEESLPAPFTPQELSLSCDESEEAMPLPGGASRSAVPQHRSAPYPAQSSLKRNGSLKQEARGELGISFVRGSSFLDDVDKIACLAVIPVESHRGLDLWFQSPGQTVQCGWCEEHLPQAQGRLLGGEGRSQFAQTDFVCHHCEAACSQSQWYEKTEDAEEDGWDAAWEGWGEEWA
ncbi:unnamed protein product [Polarella glacialis]|uniref:Uncharacterized protein n=1 Tax=Polarella glacialis TaxID=89957 RepID=A0A813HJ90_POLGL|nr:unnamed protein product [Polarella glacialis]CAE8638270.1 unnamed protein product [Polarella glacialis]